MTVSRTIPTRITDGDDALQGQSVPISSRTGSTRGYYAESFRWLWPQRHGWFGARHELRELIARMREVAE